VNSRTLYGRYGATNNIREHYRALPGQFFWTWVTGKGVPLTKSDLDLSLKVPGEFFLIRHLLYTWCLLASAIIIGSQLITELDKGIGAFAGLFLCQIIVVNRLRSLQATFHYMTHGSIIKNSSRAKKYALYFITTPLMYIDWNNYTRSHVREHHHPNVLCTKNDPDQIFIKKQGFRKGMSEVEFWLRIIFTPFNPLYLINDWIELCKDSFFKPSGREIFYRLLFWLCVTFLIMKLEFIIPFTLMFLIPRFIFFQHSMWLQLITEHLWFTDLNPDETQKQRYGRITWGRFQGREIPSKGIIKKLLWLIKLIILDIPVRLYIYPQDLPNHDFHHKKPRTSYKNIADVRVTIDRSTSSYGPSLEVWGFVSTLKLLRDHICYNEKVLFIESRSDLQTTKREEND
jgi:hypothetical protein